MNQKELLKWKQERLRLRTPEDDYPWAEGVEDASIDLMAYAEALEEKKKDPKYDMLQDKELVKAMLS